MSGMERIETEHVCQPRSRSPSHLLDLDFSFPEQDQSSRYKYPAEPRCQNRKRFDSSSCLLCSWMSAEFPKLMAKLKNAELELTERRNAETRRNILEGIINQEKDINSSSSQSSSKRSCSAEAIIELIKVKEDLLGAESRAVTLEREGLVLREEINRLKLQRQQPTDDDTLLFPIQNRKLTIFSTAVCQAVQPENVDPGIGKDFLARRVQDLINEEYIAMNELLHKQLADQVAKVHVKLRRAQRIVVKSCTLATYVRYFKSWRFRIVERKCAKREKELRVKFTNAKERCLQMRTFSLWSCKSLKRRQQFSVEKGCAIRRCFVKWATLNSIEKNRCMRITQELESQNREIETERMAYQRQMMMLQKDLTKAKVKASERNRLYSEVKILRKRCNGLKKSLRQEKVEKLMASSETRIQVIFYKWKLISLQQKSTKVLNGQLRFLSLMTKFQIWRQHTQARIVPARRTKQDAFHSWKIIAALQIKYRRAMAYEMMRLTWSANVEMNRRLMVARHFSAWRRLQGKSLRARFCKLNRALTSQYNARLRNSMWKWQLYISQEKVDLTRSVLKNQVKSCEKRICEIQARQKRNTAVLEFTRANNLKDLEKVTRRASQQMQYKDAEHDREILKIRQEMEERTSSYGQRLSENQTVHARELKVVTFRIWAAFSNKIARIKRARSIAIKKHINIMKEKSILRTQLIVFMIWSRWKNLLYKKTRRQLYTADLKLAGKLPTPIHKLFTGFLNDWHDPKICIQSNSPQLTRSTSEHSL